MRRGEEKRRKMQWLEMEGMERNHRMGHRKVSEDNKKVVFFAFALAFTIFMVAPVIAETVTYTYDDAGRLVKADYGNGTAIEYNYDNAGNLLERGITGEEPALFFDTSPGAYPSISGMHNGTITPNVTIEVSQLYTYPMCRNWRAFRICCLLSL